MTNNTNTWIPAVDGKLPVNGERVLILMVDPSFGSDEPYVGIGWLEKAEAWRKHYEDDNMRLPEGGYVWCDESYDGCPITLPSRVVAWMPLPEVPEWLSTSIRISSTRSSE